jgi:hypothetical protein
MRPPIEMWEEMYRTGSPPSREVERQLFEYIREFEQALREWAGYMDIKNPVLAEVKDGIQKADALRAIAAQIPRQNGHQQG